MREDLSETEDPSEKEGRESEEVRRDVHLVDLPGYGYAEVSKQTRREWSELMTHYFSVPERVRLAPGQARHELDLQRALSFSIP